MTTSKKSDSDLESLRLEYCFDKGINIADRIIQITGSIEENSSFDFLDSAMTEMERESKKAITLKINSPGGSVYEALAMVGRIEKSKCHITTECYGHAMSAASLILASGDKRLMSKRAWFMHHQISGGIRGSVEEVKRYHQQMEREMFEWAKCLEEYTNKDFKFWIDIAKVSDFYLSAEQCKAAGVIDELF